MQSSPATASSSSASSTSPPRTFHGLPESANAASASSLLTGSDAEEAEDTDEDWEESASYFPSTASLPALSSLPLPCLSSLPATLHSATSSLSSLLTSLPALSSISESDLRALQSTVQSVLSDSLENVMHHAKLFARVGGDWWQGTAREKERHSKLDTQRRRQKGHTAKQQRTPRGEDAEMAEYVLFLTQLVQATGGGLGVVSEQRSEAAVVSGQRLQVVQEHFGQWDERERRMVERIREELRAAKKKEVELTAAAEGVQQQQQSQTEKRAHHQQRPSRHPAASSSTADVPLTAPATATQQAIVDSDSTLADASNPGDDRPIPSSSPTPSTADIAAAARRPSSTSSARPFDSATYRPPRMITPIPTISPLSPWLSQAVQPPQPLAFQTAATSSRSVEASGYWNTHTQLFIPSSQHAALVSHGAPAAPPLYNHPSLSRPTPRAASSVVTPAVTLPFTPLAAVVASLVSADSNNASTSTSQSPPLSGALQSSTSSSQAASDPSAAAATSAPSLTSSPPPAAVQVITQLASSSANLDPAPTSTSRIQTLPALTFTSLSVELAAASSGLSSLPASAPVAPAPTEPPQSTSSAADDCSHKPLSTAAVSPAPPTASPSLSSVELSADAPPAPPMSDVPAAPPMEGVPDAPTFDSSIPPPPPMSGPAPAAATLPPPLALAATNSSTAKRSSMKRLHWSKLRYENVAQSVWSQLLQSTADASEARQQQGGLAVDVEAMKRLIDVSELEDKFSSAGSAQREGSARDSPQHKPSARANLKTASGGTAGQVQAEDERRDNSTAVNSTRSKASQFTAVDTLRAYNVEIAFSQLKMPADSIRQALLLDGWRLDEEAIAAFLECVQRLVSQSTDAIDNRLPNTTLPPSPLCDCPLSADQLDILSRIVPTDEEVARTTAAPASATPGTVEQFFRAMCSVPRVRRRVELLAFLCNGPAELLSISASLASLHSAHASVMSSPSLRRFLALVLLVGNTLNAGTSQGNAYGFRLSWLSEMAQVKTRDGTETMMEFIVRTAEKPSTAAVTPSLSLLFELQAVPAAAAIDTQSLAASLTSLRTLTSVAAREAAALPADDTLRRLLCAWVAGWQSSMQAVEASYERMLSDGRELCRYLAEDESRAEGAITVVRDVLQLYSKARDEGERKQREQRDKLKAREREQEKEEKRQQRRATHDASSSPSIPTATLLSCNSRPAQHGGPRRRKFVRSELSSSEALALDDEASGVAARAAAASPSYSPSPSSSPSSTSRASALHQSDSCSSLQHSASALSASLSQTHSPQP